MCYLKFHLYAIFPSLSDKRETATAHHSPSNKIVPASQFPVLQNFSFARHAISQPRLHGIIPCVDVYISSCFEGQPWTLGYLVLSQGLQNPLYVFNIHYTLVMYISTGNSKTDWPRVCLISITKVVSVMPGKAWKGMACHQGNQI